MAELDALVDETAETLLNAIKAAATKATVPRHLLRLAQAYALVSSYITCPEIGQQLFGEQTQQSALQATNVTVLARRRTFAVIDARRRL